MTAKLEHYLAFTAERGLATGVFHDNVEAHYHSAQVAAFVSRGAMTLPKVLDAPEAVEGGDAIGLCIDAKQFVTTSGFAIHDYIAALQLAVQTLEVVLADPHIPLRAQHSLYQLCRPLGIYIKNRNQAAAEIVQNESHAAQTADALLSLARAATYQASGWLAARLGAFPGYTPRASYMLARLQAHQAGAFGNEPSADAPPCPTACQLVQAQVPALLLSTTRERWNDVLSLAPEIGFRHAKVLRYQSYERATDPVQILPTVEQKWQARQEISQAEMLAMVKGSA